MSAARPVGRAAGIAVLMAASLTGCQADRRVHDDLHGPLSATSGGGSFAMSEPPHVKPPWHGSFGSYELCAHEPGVKIVLQRVGWRAAKDAPPLQVKPWLRTVDRTTRRTTSFIATLGLPWRPYDDKPYPGRYSDKIAGRSVTRSCADVEKGDGRSFTELIFVIETSRAGAHLTQGYVDYLADDEPYRLVINWQMITCGSAIRARTPDPEAPSCS